MHGWALLFGGLPDEASMIARLANHDRIKLKSEFMLYLVVFVGLFVLSCFVQRAGLEDEETKKTLEGEKSGPSHVEMSDERA